MALFYSVFLSTILLGIGFVFFLIKHERFGNKPVLVSGILFVIAVAIVIPLGNQLVIDSHVVSDEFIESEEVSDESEKLERKELVKNAVEADFIELNVDEPPVGKQVYLTGEINYIHQEDIAEVLMVSTKEGDGFGVYSVLNLSGRHYLEEDRVYKIYGEVMKLKQDHAPTIFGRVIIETDAPKNSITEGE